MSKSSTTGFFLAVPIIVSLSGLSTAQVAPPTPKVTTPPDSVFERYRKRDREAAQSFYKKYLDVKGMAVIASGDVADQALERTYEMVTHLLAGRPDILEVMAKHGTRLIIIGKDQVYTDMPDYRNSPNPAYLNERVRGTGGLSVTSFGEENLLNLAGDRYDDESIGLHEFCHTIDAALGTLDPTWRQKLGQTYRSMMDKELWKNTYASSNPGEYWAEICQSYFNCNRINNWNHGPIGTREQLKRYDPKGYDLVRTTFKLTPDQNWTLPLLRRQPSVISPPSRLKFDSYYTKLTYAREFPVLGSEKVSDQALLKANDTIRKMFAYRHDILKAMIAEGVRLVVLGRRERLSDLPEFKASRNTAGIEEIRYFDFNPELKLMVVPEENVLNLEGEPFAGENELVRVLATALYRVVGARPVDPTFENRRYRQQYELRVKRLDIEFDKTLKSIYEEAMSKGLWKGTPAARDSYEYWATGVLAYFDGVGAGIAPNDADKPITSREALKSYDPRLFSIAEETMAYRGKVDWRIQQVLPRPSSW